VAFASVAMAGNGLKSAPPVVHPNYIVANGAKNSPDAPTTIFNNLTTDPLALYDAISGGYYVAGPNNGVIATEQWIALPFKTKAAAVHAKSLQTAIGYISGTKQVRIRIFTDAGGVPGAALGGGSTTTVPDLGVCCGLAVVNIAGAGVALAANTQFWLVADHTAGALDFLGAWQATLVNDTIGGNVDSAGWFAFSGLIPAAKITGTNP
jgi:hypothetical protein